MTALTFEQIEGFRKKYEDDNYALSLTGAAAKTELTDLAFVPMASAKLNGDFEVEITTRGVTAQRKSGRCWLFAFMNMAREIVAEKCSLDSFELSGNYLAFYDKLEKANNMLEMAIANAKESTKTRMNEYILDSFGDGGYFSMASDLAKKYGVVPKSAMPETYQSENTEKFMKLFKSLLRRDVAELRRIVENGGDPSQRKIEMMAEVFRVECIVFGEPPAKFNFEYKDKNGSFHSDRGITPKEFYDKYVGMDLDEYVTVTDHPTRGLKAGLHYKFHYIGCMAESDVHNINLTSDELEELCLAQLRAGEPVWFGCDAGAYGARKEGVWDPDSLNFEGVLGGVDFSMTKGDRLEFHDSFATHAMILVGVNFDENGKPERWKIENSWGDEVGKKGYFVCSEKYFKEFVYEAVIKKKFLSDRQKALLDTEALEVAPWECDTL
ncbi:MAG: peptidase C1 [Clostridia bacterium]|nr:peptidase C1 [Clostridia bacterium]